VILDELMEMPLKKTVKISCDGDFGQADTFHFKHPHPEMAKESFRMVRYFNQIQKEVVKAIASTASMDELKDRAEAEKALVAGGAVESIHEEYKDGDAEGEAKKLKAIEEHVKEYTEMIGLCDGVDLYKMTSDFGKMVINNKRCLLKGKGTEGQEITAPLTPSLWEQQIDFKDRMAATIRYCCFFGLISSDEK